MMIPRLAVRPPDPVDGRQPAPQPLLPWVWVEFLSSDLGGALISPSPLGCPGFALGFLPGDLSVVLMVAFGGRFAAAVNSLERGFKAAEVYPEVLFFPLSPDV